MDITSLIFVVLALIIGAFIGALIVFLFFQSAGKKTQFERERLIQSYEQKISEINKNHQTEIEKARKESVDQSRNTLKGKMAEQMAPLLPGFNFLPADSRFLGDPVDYVVFNGYTNLRDANGNPENVEVVILDIKQNTAGLSPSQRAIAKAIEDGRVRFDIVRIFDDGTVKSHTWKSKRGKKTEVEVESE
jgi:predicted Holliday junction resolvase-like endonuclease